MNFKNWLEGLDIDKEDKEISGLNMTASLPFVPNNPLGFIGTLTRGFHLNTVVGRMMRPWINIINLFERIKDKISIRLPDSSDKIFGINKKYINKDGTLNNNFLSAYDLFKNEISKAINNLPYKEGKDIHSGSDVDVLSPVKSFLSKYGDHEEDFLDSLDKALEINLIVMGHSAEQIRNFINFLELVRDEFITIGERLPTLDEPLLEKNKKYQSDINKKLKFYERLYKSKF